MMNFLHDSDPPVERVTVIDRDIVDSKRLQMFYVCVKEGSFAAAAQRLSISPSAVSHAMKSLEEELDCSLFRRLGPQVKPTGAAVRLLPLVESLLEKMAFMKVELASLNGKVERLVFRMPATCVALLGNAAMSSFHECFPAAGLEWILKDHTNKPSEALHVDFDVDFLEHVPHEMVRRDLCSDELGAYVAPFHRLGQKARVSVEDLCQSLLIVQDRVTLEQIARHLGRSEEFGLRTWIVPDARVVLELAMQGQGMAFLPEWIARRAQEEGSLMRMKLPGFTIRRTISAWWPASRPLTWVAEVFLSLFAEDILRAQRDV
jgi:DNA-binding transcriptional LysR family regulator